MCHSMCRLLGERVRIDPVLGHRVFCDGYCGYDTGLELDECITKL